MSASVTSLYGRLSTFYFFYFATLGILIPYWSLYLQSLGFNYRQVGQLLAILMGTKLIAPYLWGWLADHVGRRIHIIRLGALMACLNFLLVFQAESYWAMATIMVLYSFFWNAVLPQYDAVTVNHLGSAHHRYSVIRLWGSIGFVVTVLLVGPLIDRFGIGLILPVTSVMFFMIWLATMLTPIDQSVSQPVPGNLFKVLRRPEILAFFMVCFLMQFSHGPYYTFFSIYLEQHGYSKTAIGQYWAVGVVAEVLIFLAVPQLIKRYGSKKLLVMSLLLAVFRWFLTAFFVADPVMLFFSQCLHAVTFGLYHAVAIYLVHDYFSGKIQGRGQALYSSLSFGAGGATGSLVSGYSWEVIGPVMSYCLAGLIALLGLAFSLYHLRKA